MLSICFIEKNSEAIDIVKELFTEYANSLNENLCFQSFDKELEDPLKKYGGPKGCLLLAYWNDEPAGCVALQPLAEEGICEMKRLYVRDKYRNKGIADELITTLLAEATKKNYTKMVLDTLERLVPAIRLYAKHGFVNTAAYYKNPLPNVMYMEKELK
jgi:ribosomal protein S18 acetylase RimI-like enzyme